MGYVNNEHQQVKDKSDVRFAIRISQHQKRELDELAEKSGLSATDYVKRKLFSSSSGETSKRETPTTSQDPRHSLSLSAKGIRASLKDNYDIYTELCEKVIAAVDADKRNPGYLYNIAHALKSVNEMLLDLQKSVNSLMDRVGENQTHEVLRRLDVATAEQKFGDAAAPMQMPKPAAPTQNVQTNPNLLKYYNMALITVVGKVADAPRQFKTKTEILMFSFKVVETELVSGKEINTYYEVISRMDETLFSRLQKGSGVTVSGNLSAGRYESEGKVYLTLKITSPQIVLH